MKTRTKEIIVDPKKTNNVGYKKAAFQKGLYSVKEKIDETKSFKNVDDSKLHYTFSV